MLSGNCVCITGHDLVTSFLCAHRSRLPSSELLDECSQVKKSGQCFSAVNGDQCIPKPVPFGPWDMRGQLDVLDWRAAMKRQLPLFLPDQKRFGSTFAALTLE